MGGGNSNGNNGSETKPTKPTLKEPNYDLMYNNFSNSLLDSYQNTGDLHALTDMVEIEAMSGFLNIWGLTNTMRVYADMTADINEFIDRLFVDFKNLVKADIQTLMKTAKSQSEIDSSFNQIMSEIV